jgi:small subunit ribosomal protein S3
MIERNFIAQKTKEYYIRMYIENKLRGAEISKISLKKIPLGEKIVIVTSRPSVIVGSRGSNIRELTRYLKSHFKLENPQIEIIEVKNMFLDANIVARRIAGSLERFGSSRFKGVGHKTMANVLSAGAIGVEIKISGKIPGSRAKSWRFYQGYLKKCGDISVSGVRTAYATALLKSGVIGIQVRIMPGDLVLPDFVEILSEPIQVIEEVEVEKIETPKKKKTATRKKSTKKKVATKKKSVEKSAEVKKEEIKTVEVKPVEVKPVVSTKVTETKEEVQKEVTKEETKENKKEESPKISVVAEEKLEEKSQEKPAEKIVEKSSEESSEAKAE